MEGVGEVIKLKGELTEAYKFIAEKETENQRLLVEIAVLKKRLRSEGDAGDRDPEPSPVMERKADEILPKECWRLVFLNLNPEDLLSCRKVCKTFNQIMDLEEFKGKWKFKLILPLLLPYLKASNPVCDRWEHLIKARLTCRSWHHWIDQYLSEVHGTSSFPIPRTNDKPLLSCFRTAVDVDVFLQRFRQCTTNKFPSRSVFIGGWYEELVVNEDCTKRLQKSFIRKVDKLFKQFGKHIFRLVLYFDSKPDYLTLCKLIKGVATHVPNLREFVIHREEVGEDLGEVEEDEISTYIEDNALASLPKLQALSIGGFVEEVEDYLLNAYGPQLTHLETRFSENSLSLFQMQQFKNMRKLWLSLDEPDDTLESFLGLQSPLKHLKLTCSFWLGQETWNVDKGLRNLRHLPIEVLEIHVWHWDRVNLTEAGLDLKEYKNASIKTLIIRTDRLDSNDGHQISFNFLQALTKLENLEFKFAKEQLRTTHPGELHEVVKLNEYLFGGEGTDLPYHSNVWEKVPSLKTLTLGLVQDKDDSVFVYKSTFTRKKYERARAMIIAEGDFKTIAEKKVEIVVLKKRFQSKEDLEDDREAEVKSSRMLLERKAEEIIPKECWGLVFQNLDADDLLSCRQVCKAFKKLLELKEFKEKWTFKLALPLLLPYLKTSDREETKWEPLYNTRLVCRSWRHSIDQYVSEVYGTQEIFPTTAETRKMPPLTRIRNQADIENFQEIFRKRKINPFPSRSVYIGIPHNEEVEDEEEFIVQQGGYDTYDFQVEKLLKKFGKHIFRLQLCFHYCEIYGPSPLTLWKLIRGMAIRLPNLKELFLRSGPSPEKYKKREKVVSYIAKNTRAALPKLRALHFSGSYNQVDDYFLDVFGPQVVDHN